MTTEDRPTGIYTSTRATGDDAGEALREFLQSRRPVQDWPGKLENRLAWALELAERAEELADSVTVTGKTKEVAQEIRQHIRAECALLERRVAQAKDALKVGDAARLGTLLFEVGRLSERVQVRAFGELRAESGRRSQKAARAPKPKRPERLLGWLRRQLESDPDAQAKELWPLARLGRYVDKMKLSTFQNHVSAVRAELGLSRRKSRP